jgi:hypothetical protein
VTISGWNVDDLSVTGAPVPEPSSLALLGIVSCLAALHRQRKKQQVAVA